MTAAQRAAIGHPCLLAEECAHPRYAWGVPGSSLVLTVNAGYE